MRERHKSHRAETAGWFVHEIKDVLVEIGSNRITNRPGFLFVILRFAMRNAAMHLAKKIEEKIPSKLRTETCISDG